MTDDRRLDIVMIGHFAKDILVVDDCWEGAYRLMMSAYDHLGNRSQVIRTYLRCVIKLQTELGVEPAPATVMLFESLQQPPS